MPLPWKKTKVARISQIVADFQSPKRGGSLVVETGFPTSLIDLFVKNRSRFQQRSSKKHRSLEISDSQPPLKAPPPSPTSLAASSEVSPETARFVNETVDDEIHEDATSGSTLTRVGERDGGFNWTTSNSEVILEVSTEPTSSEIPVRSLSAREIVHENEDSVEYSGRVLDGVGKCDKRIQPNKVFVIIFNILAVVVLMLSIKKLIVGITLSVFVVILSEFVGKHIVCHWNAEKELKSLVPRVSYLFQKISSKKTKNGEDSEQEKTVSREEVIELCSASSSIEEIDVVQVTKSDTGIHSELNILSGDKTSVCPEIEDESKRKVVDEGKISGCRTKGKCRAEFKSKMMKILVPRKLRDGRKGKKEKKNKDREAESSIKVSSTMEGYKSARFEIKEQETVIQSTKGEEEVDYGTTCSIDEDGRIDNSGSSEYFILILIALSGLVGGRIIAMLFTVVGCFMLKIVKTRGISLKLSWIKVSL